MSLLRFSSLKEFFKILSHYVFNPELFKILADLYFLSIAEINKNAYLLLNIMITQLILKFLFI